MEIGLVPTLLIILVAAMVGGALAHRLRQPIILGFVLAGIVLGPYTGGITVTELIDAKHLSEVGVGLLLFVLGVEFSLTTLRPASTGVLLGTPLQLLLTVLLGLLLGLILGWQRDDAFWFASLIALSSPIIALQTFTALELTGTAVARVVRGILIVQNLAIIPFVFLSRQIQAGTPDLTSAVIAALEGAVFLAVLLFLGIRILPPLFAALGRLNSEDLPGLVVFASAAVVIAGTYLYGLTFVEVAFVIGLLLSVTEQGSRALRALLSMRDLFGVLFFVSAGLLLDLPYLGRHILLIVLLVLVVSAGKMAIFAGIMRLFGHDRGDALTVGVTLFQLSELSFVLARLALDGGAITDDLYSLVISVGLLTMLLTPFVARLALRLQPQPVTTEA